MVKFSDLLVDKSLHRQGTDWGDVIRQQIWFSSHISHIVTLTIDGVTSILQLLDVQNILKILRFSLDKSCGKFWQSVQDGEIVIDCEVFAHVFNLFVC